jgi:hypothetical protein
VWSFEEESLRSGTANRNLKENTRLKATAAFMKGAESMDAGTVLTVIGIMIGLFDFLVAKKVSKSKRLHKNRIVIKSKGDASFGDVVGGDKITSGSHPAPHK